MSQLGPPLRPVSPGKVGAADVEGCPVTSAARVPDSRRFPQYVRGLLKTGQPVTRVARAPPPPSSRGNASGALARFLAPSPDPWLGAPSPACRVEPVGRRGYTSFVSAPPTLQGGTTSGTRSSVDDSSSSSGPSDDGCRASARSRIPGHGDGGVDQDFKWISRPLPDGSRSGRRQRASFASG
jgi:hypothetical protein